MACGYHVVERGPGHVIARAFYDSNTGALVGISERYDNGPPACSGEIPEDCAEIGADIEDAEELCPPFVASDASVN
jgi:hypothetical protein